MRVWNGADERAVVVTESTIRASEILSGVPHLVIASPGALCVGIYDTRLGKSLPVRYVPPELAREDVPSGWYAPARPHTPFAVAVTPTIRCPTVTAGFHAQALVADVTIDGMPANPRGRVVDPNSKAEYFVPGFVIEREIRDGIIAKRVREFTFASESCTVQLRVRGAVRGPKRVLAENVERYEGSAKGSGVTKKVIRKCRRNGYVMLGLWDMPHFAIEVRLRTEKWLKTRGILEKDVSLELCESACHTEGFVEKEKQGAVAEYLVDEGCPSDDKYSKH